VGDAVAKATAAAKAEVANFGRALPKSVPATVFQTLLNRLNCNRIGDQKEIANIRDVKLKEAKNRIAKLESDLANAGGSLATQGVTGTTGTGGFNFGSIA
jgi:ribosomal protein L7/L12